MKLSDRVGLAGPDREVDALIFRAIDAPLPADFAGKKLALTFDEARSAFFMEMGDMVVRYEPPAYTASIDVAATLVPELGKWSIAATPAGDWHSAIWTVDGDALALAAGATPALALCAAALKARGL